VRIVGDGYAGGGANIGAIKRWQHSGAYGNGRH